MPIDAPTEPAATDNPFRERDAACAAIAALQTTEHFTEAARQAAECPPVLRRDALIAAFHPWGRKHPDAAFAAAIRLADATDRNLAIEAVLSGWAWSDPAGLADASLHFPAGPERDEALTKSLREWMHRDPGTAGDWILAHDSGVQEIAEKMFASENR